MGQGSGGAEALAEVLGVGHLHAEHGALVLHANVLGAVGQLEEGQVGQVVEQLRDLEVLQLGDGEREDFVPDSVQVSEELVRILRLEVLEQLLNVDLDVGLLVGVTVLLLLDVLHSGILLALLLPVGLLVDVAGCNCNGQVSLSPFDDLVLNVGVLFETSQMWVQREVLGNHLQSDLLQGLDFVGGEGGAASLLCIHDGLGNVAIIEGFALLGNSGVFLGGLA